MVRALERGTKPPSQVDGGPKGTEEVGTDVEADVGPGAGAGAGAVPGAGTGAGVVIVINDNYQYTLQLYHASFDILHQ